MPHSSVHIFVHIVWITKYFHRLLFGDTALRVKAHIEENAATKQIKLIASNVQPEHVHVLTELGRSQCIDDIVQLMKGESSHWINEHNLLRRHFTCQRGYWAASVDRNGVFPVKSYIKGQDEHHMKFSFREEYAELLRASGYTEEEIKLYLLELGQ
ncbi:MAG: hypothetical protein A3H45_10985 [Ignavibacteria bacterium RIFCSPLOWO2_02_FULL_55_14]|nr:MAG: hypothetical protein A2X68_03690 [Ignavibacteria bacterium GWC2_56_12]OGU74483.1 MAG: hypothetical protein A3H45_10985 [Ignavibacteria bacterium RIFCSPLOWO2_02_FULL_55_14]